MNNSNNQEQKRTRREFESELIAKVWKDEAFKQELLINPKAIYEQYLEQKLPENLQIHVVEENAQNLYLVIPKAPQISEELSDKALETIAGGKSVITVIDEGLSIIVRW
jgi:hypothetical protein